jgi:hypothetical protein
MSITALRSAVLTAGGQPTQYTHVGLLRELITAWGGTPTQWTINGLLKEAIVTAGGTATYNTQLELLRQLITQLGGTPIDYIKDDLWSQLSLLATLSPPGAPHISVAPTISAPNGFIVGQQITINNGTWTNSPTSFHYQLYADGVPIGTDSSTYTLTSAEQGKRLSARVRAVNVSGSGYATTSLYGPVTVLPVVGFSLASISQNEGNTGETDYVYTLSRTGDLSFTSTVNFAVTGSGVNPAAATDFVGGAFPSGTITLNPGDTSATLTIPVAGDAAVESDESFTVTLSTAVNCSLGASTAVGTIINDDSVGGGSGGLTLAAPVLTKTSSSGTNPPTWDTQATNLQQDDTIELYYTEDGSTPVANGSPQGSITYDARMEEISWGAAWPNPFPGSITLKWLERYGRIDPGSGLMAWSPVSNVLSDVMPASGGVATPISVQPAHDATNATTHTFANITTGAGRVVVAVSAFFVAGVVLRPHGAPDSSTDIPLTLIANASGTRDDALLYWTPSPIAAGAYDWIVSHTSAQNDCAVFGWTVTGVTTAGAVFGIGAGTSSTDYAGTVPALAAGAIYLAVAHAFANTAMSWSGAATPTKDTELQAGSTISCAHGNTAGALHCVPNPGAFGGYTGVVLNP